MKEFQKFYLWGMNTKFYMGLYFSAMVFLGGLLVVLFGGDSLRIITLLQMLLLSFAIALVQVWVLPDSVDFSRGILFGRSICWLLFSAAAVAAVSAFGGWFQGLPSWCPLLMGGFMLFGGGAMLVGLKLEQEADTVHLNAALEEYQKKNRK